MIGQIQQQDKILLVARDEDLRASLQESLESTGRYLTSTASTFEEALSELFLSEFDMIIAETELPDLSGMDLLAVVGGLRPGTPVMLIDDDLSAKSAIAAMRLGACDYLYKPVNMHLMLMQIDRQISLQRAAQQPPRRDPKPAPQPSRNREERLNPSSRPAALLLQRKQFEIINKELNRLLSHIRANFVGLVDSEGNLAGAAGDLGDYDLLLLTRALSIDHSTTSTLANVLNENQFHATYLEGEHSGVYIIEIAEPYLLSLAVICPIDVKPGMVWLYSKRTAETIASVLQTLPQLPVAPQPKW
jgi:DNA-binding response OmpR family regulator